MSATKKAIKILNILKLHNELLFHGTGQISNLKNIHLYNLLSPIELAKTDIRFDIETQNTIGHRERVYFTKQDWDNVKTRLNRYKNYLKNNPNMTKKDAFDRSKWANTFSIDRNGVYNSIRFASKPIYYYGNQGVVTRKEIVKYPILEHRAKYYKDDEVKEVEIFPVGEFGKKRKSYNFPTNIDEFPSVKIKTFYYQPSSDKETKEIIRELKNAGLYLIPLNKKIKRMLNNINL